jgi:hypothetical protein
MQRNTNILLFLYRTATYFVSNQGEISMRHHCSSDEAFGCVFGQSSATKRHDTAKNTLPIEAHTHTQTPSTTRSGKRICTQPTFAKRIESRKHVEPPRGYHDDSECGLPQLVHRAPRRKMPQPPCNCLLRDRGHADRETFAQFHHKKFSAPAKPTIPLSRCDELYNRISILLV